MDFHSIIKLPKGVFRDVGDRTLKLWAGSKGVSSRRRPCVRRRLVSTPRSGVWSDFNQADANRFGDSSILHSAGVDRGSSELIDFRQLKIPLGLLLAAPLAVCVCGVIVAEYHSKTLTAFASTLGTKLVKRVQGHSMAPRLGTLPEPRLLPIQVLPDPVVTPGEAQNISLAEVKKLGPGPPHLSNIPTDLKRTVYGTYGLSLDEKNYQLDYLIPLCLGGSNSAKNLWPHSRKGSFWTVEKKLRLEKRLYRLVCARRLPLVTARQELASNWVKAYRKYVDKTAPLLLDRSSDKLSISTAQSSAKNWR
jgi:hypothetical protein